MSFMTELRSKRDRSDTASLLTVDEITAEVENRRQSMAVDMGVEGAEDWTKVEPDIDDVTSLSEDDTVFDDDEDEDESQDVEEEDETGQTMNSSGGKPKATLKICAMTELIVIIRQVDQRCAYWCRVLWEGLLGHGCCQRSFDGCEASGAAERVSSE